MIVSRLTGHFLRSRDKMGFLKKMIAWTLMLFCALLIGGCGTVLTSQGAAVRITNDYGDAMGCTYLGQTTASSSLGGYGLDNKGLESSINELRNNAAQMGANILVIHMVTEDGTYTDMTGDAYRCDEP